MTKKQKQLLGLLKEIDALCRKHGLRYVMAGGSLLGVIRNRGFLPWDDDIDIYMPRDDWEELVGLAEEELPDHRVLIDVGTMREYTNSFPRYGSTDTCAIHKHQITGRDAAGEIIDVLTLDPVPSDEKSYKKYRTNFMIYSDLINPFTTYGSRWEIPLWKYLYYRCMEKVSGREKTFRNLEKKMYAWKEKDCDRFAMRWGGCPFLFSKDMMFPVKEMPFEDMMVYVPNHVIEYLIWHYGDEWPYIPPHAERESHEAICPDGIDYEQFRKLYMPMIDAEKLLKNAWKGKITKLRDARSKNAVEDEKLALYAVGVQMDLDARLDHGKRSLSALVNRRDFETLSEIFSDYFTAQLSASFIGREDFANIRKFEHPTLIEIRENQFDAAMLTLFYTEKISKANRLLGLVRSTKGLDETCGLLYQDIARLRQAVTGIEEGKETEAAEICDMLNERYPDNPSILKLMLWLSARTSDKEKTDSLVRQGRDIFPDDGYFIKYEADLLWAKGKKNEALELYAKVHKSTNNGMIWLDLESVPGHDKIAAVADCIRRGRLDDPGIAKRAREEIRVWKQVFPDDEEVRAAGEDIRMSAAFAARSSGSIRKVRHQIEDRIRLLIKKDQDVPGQYYSTLARVQIRSGLPRSLAAVSARLPFTEDYETLEEMRYQVENEAVSVFGEAFVSREVTRGQGGYYRKVLGDILLAQGKVTEAFGCYRLAMRELPQGTVREQLRRLILDDLVKGQAKLRVIAAKTDAGEYLDGWLDKYGSLKEIQSLVR
ncbi:MAG: LicD family protein [Blautia sp.]|nr:LicD family protein [Blautia sp.]